MKIALINKVMSASGGGAERYAVDLARVLVKAEHEVDCYAVVLEDLPAEVQCFSLPKPKKPGFRKIIGFSQSAAKAVAASGKQYDVVYSLTQAYPCDLYFMGGGMHRHWMTQRYQNQWFRWWRYCTNPTNLAQVWIEDRLCEQRNCRKILANSHMIKRHAMAYGGAKDDQVVVVHNGIDPAVFHPGVREQYREEMRASLGLEDGDLGLLFVSHNWKRKGLATLIEALGRVGRDKETGKRYRLIVAGKGKASRWSSLAEKWGVSDRIIWHGPTRQPEQLYAAGDVFVLPTWYDPCAGVTLEAMACGLPVISSGGNGASELIVEGETGYVVEDSRDAMGLAKCLDELLHDEKRQAMGMRGAEVIAPRTFEVVMQETLVAMESLKR